jgi:hypothetical protein
VDEAAALGWSYDPGEGALRLRAAPVRWPVSEWLPSSPDTAASPSAESAEGFWIARPWTASELCPTADPPPVPVPQPPDQTLGLVEFFTSEGSRVGRRDGKPFQAVQKVAPEALAAGTGFQLRLRGRIQAAPDGRTILCRSAGSHLRPICLISVKLDEVAFENPATRTTIATWDVAEQDSRSEAPARASE